MELGRGLLTNVGERVRRWRKDMAWGKNYGERIDIGEMLGHKLWLGYRAGGLSPDDLNELLQNIGKVDNLVASKASFVLQERVIRYEMKPSEPIDKTG